MTGLFYPVEPVRRDHEMWMVGWPVVWPEWLPCPRTFCRCGKTTWFGSHYRRNRGES